VLLGAVNLGLFVLEPLLVLDMSSSSKASVSVVVRSPFVDGRSVWLEKETELQEGIRRLLTLFGPVARLQRLTLTASHPVCFYCHGHQPVVASFG
jgi:hypothetical protein